jgi:hypothetical protein
MSQTAAHLVDHVIPHVRVQQRVLSRPIPLRLLLAAQPGLVTLVLQVVQRVVARHLLDGAGLKVEEGHGGVVTLIQRFWSAANSTSTCTAWCWTGRTGVAPIVRQHSSRRMRPPPTNRTRCCSPSLPG